MHHQQQQHHLLPLEEPHHNQQHHQERPMIATPPTQAPSAPYYKKASSLASPLVVSNAIYESPPRPPLWPDVCKAIASLRMSVTGGKLTTCQLNRLASKIKEIWSLASDRWLRGRMVYTALIMTTTNHLPVYMETWTVSTSTCPNEAVSATNSISLWAIIISMQWRGWWWK